MAETVLIVEDDRDIVELLTLYLSGSGYEVLAASDGEEALERLARSSADIALVDIMMPRMNGYDFIKTLRQTSDIPVIIISARSHPADKIVGLDAGADGFISKPFEPLEVTAYIRAMLRRHAASERSEGDAGSEEEQQPHAGAARQDAGEQTMRVGDLAFDTKRLVLSKNGAPIPLTAAELKIMAALMAAPGRVFSKGQLYACVNGEAYAGSEGSVMVHISNIRSKLEDDPLRPRYIKTIRGMGYRLDG